MHCAARTNVGTFVRTGGKNHCDNAKRVHFAEKRVVRRFGKSTRNIIGRDRLESASTKNSDPEIKK